MRQSFYKHVNFSRGRSWQKTWFQFFCLIFFSTVEVRLVIIKLIIYLLMQNHFRRVQCPEVRLSRQDSQYMRQYQFSVWEWL